MHSKKSILIVGLVLLALTGMVLMCLPETRAPKALSASAPPEVFSAMRARAHLEQIGRSPHPLGSAAEKDVLAYITNTIAQMGVEPQVERRSVLVHPSTGDYVAGKVTNVLAVLPGSANSEALLLVAHYDSVASSFGVSDDGNGVAVLLETLRALRAGQPLRNDIIFLFTDGEEAGSLGARAFLEDHCLGHKVGLVLNFEAHGTSGAAFLFETTRNNGWMVREFAKAAPYPAASSLFYEIYRRLPNDTDLTAFKEAGLAGMNFAYSGDQLFYHTAGDNLSHLDAGSLQHQGFYALSLARWFGNLNLERVARPNLIFFSVLRSYLLWYPESWASPLAVLLLLATLTLVMLGLRTHALLRKEFIAAMLAFPLACLACGLSATGLWWLVRQIQPQYRAFLPVQGDVYNHTWYILAIGALSIAIMAVIFLRRVRQGSAWNLVGGAIIWLAIANLCLAILAPGASYLLTWPVLAMLILLSAAVAKPAWRLHGAMAVPVSSLLLMCLILLCCAPAVFLLIPLSQYLFIGFGMQAAGLGAMVFAVLVGLIAPLISLIPLRPLVASASLACLGLLVGGSLTSGFSPAHPRQNTVFYALDADSGSAVWANRQSQQDSWSTQYLGVHPQNTLLPFVSPSHRVMFQNNRAPSLTLAPPEVMVLEDSRMNNIRHLRLLLKSPRGASTVFLYPENKVLLYSLQINATGPRLVSVGTGIASPFDVLMIRGLPPEGMPVTMDVQSGAPFHFRVVDKTEGLPAIPEMSFKARASWMIRSRDLDLFNDSTLVSKTFAP